MKERESCSLRCGAPLQSPVPIPGDTRGAREESQRARVWREEAGARTAHTDQAHVCIIRERAAHAPCNLRGRMPCGATTLPPKMNSSSTIEDRVITARRKQISESSRHKFCLVRACAKHAHVFSCSPPCRTRPMHARCRARSRRACTTSAALRGPTLCLGCRGLRRLNEEIGAIHAYAQRHPRPSRSNSLAKGCRRSSSRQRPPDKRLRR